MDQIERIAWEKLMVMEAFHIDLFTGSSTQLNEMLFFPHGFKPGSSHISLSWTDCWGSSWAMRNI